MEKLPITKEGFAVLQAEYDRLKKVERPAIIQQISEARDHGDLKENAEYHSARDKQSFIEGRIKYLEDYQARSQVIDISTMSGDKVKFGAKIHLIDCDTEEEKKYQIVGEYEANLDIGKISLTSPIARSLMNKKIGDEVKVKTPKMQKIYEILNVEYN